MFSITDESKINISAEILSVLGRSFGCSQSDFSFLSMAGHRDFGGRGCVAYYCERFTA